jgi:tetratricopeptide (TPR) repeat protein
MSQLVSHPAAVRSDVEQRPLVTAVLVTNNKESHIRECVCGLMEQSVAARMEVIVVDLGSQQSEGAVVADLQRRFQNLIFLRTAVSKGTSSGLNLALKIASGKYLTVIEATDRLKDDAYELLAATLNATPGAMLAYGDTCFTAIPHETFDNHTSYGKMIWPDYTHQQLSQLSLIAPHLMWRKELNDKIGGFDESYESQGMRDFLLRVADKFRMVHVEEFTGLKLVAAGAPLNDTSEREFALLKLNYQATTACQPVTPAPALSPELAAPVQASAAPNQPAQPSPAQINQPAPPVTLAAIPAASKPAPAPAPSAEASYLQIQALLDSGSEQQARQALVSHLERYPQHALAHNDLASLLYRAGDLDAALSYYRSAVQLAPEESTFHKNLADLCFVEAGLVDEAIGIYLKLLDRSPRDTETLLNLGIICATVGQPTEAEAFYQRALEIEPWNQTVRQRITDLRQSLAEPAPCEDEDSAEDLYEKAQALVAQGDLDAAARELESILKIDPEFSLAHNDLAVIHYQNGSKDEALAHYQKAAALAPKNSTFQKNLADFYFVEGRDIDGAIAIYLELLQKEPRNIETLMNLGRICSMLDRPEEAKTFYGKVTQLEPWNRDARECLTTLRHCANG